MIKDQKSSQDLARKTEVHRKLKRMGRGARKVKPGGGKGPESTHFVLSNSASNGVVT